MPNRSSIRVNRDPLDTTNDPLTAGAVLDAALARTDLPQRLDRTWRAYLGLFPDGETRRRLTIAHDAARSADSATARHWTHQAELRWHDHQREQAARWHR